MVGFTFGMERASSMAGEGPIREEHLPLEIRQGENIGPVDDAVLILKDEVARTERRTILRALSLTNGNRTEAARLLGIHRTGLYQKMRQHGLNTREKR